MSITNELNILQEPKNKEETSAPPKSISSLKAKEYKAKFKKAEKKRYKKLKGQILYNNSPYESMVFPQKDSSRYLIEKSKTYKELIKNDFSVKTSNIKAFFSTFFLDSLKFHNGSDTITYYYIEIHTEKNIFGVMYKDTVNLERELAKDGKLELIMGEPQCAIRQIKFSQKFLKVHRHTENNDTWIDLLTQRWSESFDFDSAKAFTDKTALFTALQVLSLSFLATVDYNDIDFPLYIINFVGNNEQRDKMKSLFESCYFPFGELNAPDYRFISPAPKTSLHSIDEYRRITLIDLANCGKKPMPFFKDYEDYIKHFHDGSRYPYKGLFVLFSENKLDDELYNNIDSSMYAGSSDPSLLMLIRKIFIYFFTEEKRKTLSRYSLIINRHVVNKCIKHSADDYISKNKHAMFAEGVVTALSILLSCNAADVEREETETPEVPQDGSNLNNGGVDEIGTSTLPTNDTENIQQEVPQEVNEESQNCDASTEISQSSDGESQETEKKAHHKKEKKKKPVNPDEAQRRELYEKLNEFLTDYDTRSPHSQVLEKLQEVARAAKKCKKKDNRPTKAESRNSVFISGKFLYIGDRSLQEIIEKLNLDTYSIKEFIDDCVEKKYITLGSKGKKHNIQLCDCNSGVALVRLQLGEEYKIIKTQS